MTTLTLDQASALVTATLAHGREHAFKPLTVAVLDAGGHLIAFGRQDGSSTLRPQIAMGKAGGALGLGVSSRIIAEMAADRPSFLASLGPIAAHGVIPAAGGIIIATQDGAVIGAVGVTGDTSDNDEASAMAGLASVGLRALERA